MSCLPDRVKEIICIHKRICLLKSLSLFLVAAEWFWIFFEQQSREKSGIYGHLWNFSYRYQYFIGYNSESFKLLWSTRHYVTDGFPSECASALCLQILRSSNYMIRGINMCIMCELNCLFLYNVVLSCRTSSFTIVQ